MAKKDWHAQRVCGKLSWQEADYYFFGRRKMHLVAKEKFCDNCPVLKQCLSEALEFGDQEKGFVAGTEWEDREAMLITATLVSQTVDRGPTGYQQLAEELQVLLELYQALELAQVPA